MSKTDQQHQELAFFQEIFEHAADASLLMENDSFLDCNQAAVKMLRAKNKAEILATPPCDFSPERQPDGSISAEKAQKMIQQALKKGNHRFEWVHRRLDGEEFPAEVSLTPITTGGKNIIHASWREISAKKEIEIKLKRLAAIVNVSNDAIFSIDTEGKINSWNPSAEKVFGYTYKEIIGKPVQILVPPEQKEEAQTRLKHLQSGDEQTIETIRRKKDGTKINVRVHNASIKDEQGRIVGLGITLTDITEFKKLEKKIQAAYERRGYEVQISTEISQKIAQATELSELFKQIVTLTKERLGYYHTQLLRYEPNQNAVILVAGYGSIGQKMLAQGHRIPLGKGLIGKAAVSGETMLRTDLSSDADWLPNPLLPKTRGEISVPIKLSNKILGVLDVQCEQAEKLTADDRLLLEGLCGQIAIAMEHTRLRQEMEEHLEEINRLYQTVQHKGWQEYKSSGELPKGFIYDQTAVRPLEETQIAEENFANIPLELPGGEILGELGIAENPETPLKTEDKVFLEQASTQIALALESARLFEQTQAALNEVQRLGSAVEQSVDGMAIADMDGTIQFVNRAWAAMHGYTTEELIGKPLNIFHTKEQLENEVIPFNEGVQEHGVNQGEVGHKRKDGSTFPTWMTVSIMKNDNNIPVALVASAQDITERKEAEKAIEKRAAELATVAEVSTAAARALNTETLLQDVVDLTRKRFNLYHTHIYLLNKEKERLEVKACGWEDGSPHAESSEEHTIPLFAERSIVAQATRNRQAIVVNNVHEDPNWLPNKLLPKTQSEMAVPLIVGDEILGVYDIQSDEINRFTDEDVSIQTTLASQVAVALQNARSYQQAQQLAEHEALINVIGQRIQGTTSVEDALQVAVRELGRALGAKQASIQLNVGAKKNA